LAGEGEKKMKCDICKKEKEWVLEMQDDMVCKECFDKAFNLYEAGRQDTIDKAIKEIQKLKKSI